MTHRLTLGTHLLGLWVFAAAAAGQGPPPATPRAADPAAVLTGTRLFRERCAECHGADARGVPRHDLTRLWAAGATDAQVFSVIRGGVPNTIMPSSTAPDDEVWAIVAYLRSLNTAAGDATASGSAAAGERTFQAMCAGCHAVNGRGGRLGPDLSRAGSQPRQQVIASIRTPDAAMANGYRAVTLVLSDGRRIRGVEKSEDAFSIQIMDTQQRLQGYLKATLREVVQESSSVMPAFPPERLSDGALDDLLTFLSSVAGPAAPRRQTP
jgi:putative heme-binding domain-containing protein